jgi:hypothetical protein
MIIGLIGEQLGSFEWLGIQQFVGGCDALQCDGVERLV